MVRAAFEGDGAIFHQPQHVSSLHIMADGTNNSGNGSREQSSSDEAALSARLGSLDQRLSEIRDSRKTQTDQTGAGSGDGAARASAMARGKHLGRRLEALLDTSRPRRPWSRLGRTCFAAASTLIGTLPNTWSVLVGVE